MSSEIKTIVKYYEPELKEVRVIITEDELIKAEKEIKRLNNIIDEAIEYIKQNMKQEYIHTDYIYTMIDILQGGDSNG